MSARKQLRAAWIVLGVCLVQILTDPTFQFLSSDPKRQLSLTDTEHQVSLFIENQANFGLPVELNDNYVVVPCVKGSFNTTRACPQDCLFGDASECMNGITNECHLQLGNEYVGKEVTGEGTLKWAFGDAHSETNPMRLNFFCQDESTHGGALGMSPGPYSFLSQLYENYRIPEKVFGVCFHHNSILLTTLGQADSGGRIQWAKQSPRSSYYAVHIRRVYLGHRDWSMLSLDNADYSYLNGTADAVFFQARDTMTFLHKALEEEFKAAFKQITGIEYTLYPFRLPPEEYEKLPSIYLQFEGAQNSTNTITAAEFRDPQNPDDILLEIPPSSYLVYDGGTAYPTIAFASGTASIGSNVLQHHEVTFHAGMGKVGFSKKEGCQSVAAQEEGFDSPEAGNGAGPGEIKHVKCSGRKQVFESSVFMSVAGHPTHIQPWEMRALEESFQATYNEVGGVLCDDHFRRIVGISFEPKGFRRLTTDAAASNSRGRIMLDQMIAEYRGSINATCRNCHGQNTTLFHGDERRLTSTMDTTGVSRSLFGRVTNATKDCMCVMHSDKEPRAPTISEFVDAYNVSVTSMVQQGKLINVVGVEYVNEILPDTSTKKVETAVDDSAVVLDESANSGFVGVVPPRNSSAPMLSVEPVSSESPEGEDNDVTHPNVNEGEMIEAGSSSKDSKGSGPKTTEGETVVVDTSGEVNETGLPEGDEVPVDFSTNSKPIEQSVNAEPEGTEATESRSVIENEIKPVSCSPDQGSFRSTVFVGIMGDPSLISPEEVVSLGWSFAASYNGLGVLLCDNLFRRITETSFSLQGIRRTDVGLLPIYDGGSNNPGNGRSLNQVTAQYRGEVNGTCRQCSGDTKLFEEFAKDRELESEHEQFVNSVNEEMARNLNRTLLQDIIKAWETSSLDSLYHGGLRRSLSSADMSSDCQCVQQLSSPTNTAATASEFLIAFNDTINELARGGVFSNIAGVTDVEEVTPNRAASISAQVPMECGDDLKHFHSTVLIGIAIDPSEAGPDGLAGLGQGFGSTYNGLAELLCDDTFRRVTGVTFALEGVRRSQYQERALTQSPIADYRLSVNATCRGCSGDTSLFGEDRRLSSSRPVGLVDIIHALLDNNFDRTDLRSRIERWQARHLDQTSIASSKSDCLCSPSGAQQPRRTSAPEFIRAFDGTVKDLAEQKILRNVRQVMDLKEIEVVSAEVDGQ